MLRSILKSLPFYHERKVIMNFINTKISRNLCIRFTSDDAQVAIPMMIASILALAVLF